MPRRQNMAANAVAGTAPDLEPQPSGRALTRHNMRGFDRAHRQETARETGQSTPTTERRPSSYESASTNSVERFAREIVWSNRPRREEAEGWGQPAPPPGPSPEPVPPKWMLNPKSDPAENQGTSGINTDRGKSLFDPVTATDAAEMDGSELAANSVAHIRPPRPARRHDKLQEGSVKQWDTQWNQQSPPLPPSRPQVESNPTDLASMFPTNFPRFHPIQNFNDFGAYLANASYIVSVGGPPLADIRYGIILVPVGDEKLLLGEQPEVEASNRLEEALRHPRDRLGLHELDRDSEDFLRCRNVPRDHNTESAPGSLYSAGIERQTTGHPVNEAEQAAVPTQNVQATRIDFGNMQTQPPVNEEGDSVMAEAEPVLQADEPRPAANKKGKRQVPASRRTASKPQGVAKKSSASRRKAVQANTPVAQPTSARALRSRELKA